MKFTVLIFSALVAGTLNPANFRASTTGTAADANDFVLYNTSDGSLLYDTDGSGAAAAIQFAVLGGNPLITAADFLLV